MPKLVQKFAQIPNKPSKTLPKDLLKYCQIGKISPNLVTMAADKNSDTDNNLLKDVGLASDETSWRRAVENQSYVERILQLLAGLGTNLEVVIRISPATKFLGNGSQRIHPSQMRIDNYFRDEILNSKLNLRFELSFIDFS